MQEPNVALVAVLKRLTNLTQQKHDTITNYYISDSSPKQPSSKLNGEPSIHPS
jgi:hypothetical protein